MKVPDSNMAKPVLSIIIISFNTKEVTLNCLKSVVKSHTSVPYEIIVIDNASSDHSPLAIKALSEKYPQIRLIEHTENIGFGQGNNAAVKLAQGMYLLFLNSDIVVQEKAIDELFNFFNQNKDKVSFAGGKLINKNLTPQPSCGPFFTPLVVFGFLFLRGDYWGLTRFSPNRVKEVDWVSGACILTRKEPFEALGGFDEKIFMYMEEIDLLYRAKKRGLRTFFCPQARFIHLGSTSSVGRTFPILQVYRGYLYFYKKHYGRAALFILKIMLQLKAKIAVLIGRSTKNPYLIKTYEEAAKLVQEA